MAAPAVDGMQVTFTTGRDDDMQIDHDAAEEQRLKDDIDQLQMLHIKLRELRTLIPRMLEPLHKAEQKKPVELHADLKKSRADALAELKTFEEAFQSVESAQALDRARKSRKANPKGIKPWRETGDPNWLDQGQ